MEAQPADMQRLLHIIVNPTNTHNLPAQPTTCQTSPPYVQKRAPPCHHKTRNLYGKMSCALQPGPMPQAQPYSSSAALICSLRAINLQDGHHTAHTQHTPNAAQQLSTPRAAKAFRPKLPAAKGAAIPPPGTTPPPQAHKA